MLVRISDLGRASQFGAWVVFGLVVLAAHKWWTVAQGRPFDPISKWSFLILGWLLLFSGTPGVGLATLRMRRYLIGGRAEKPSDSRPGDEDNGKPM